MELLDGLRPVLDDYERTWVTSKGARARDLEAEGERVLTVSRLDRRSIGAGSLTSSARTAISERPDLVVTSGAGLAVPFAAIARLRGAKIVFIETMARVHTGSASGRVISRFASDVLVQWPELRAVYPSAHLCRPLLLDGVKTVGGGGGEGTFVTVGSHDQPFTRLLDAVAAAADGLLPEPVIVQCGVGEINSPAVSAVSFMPPAEFTAAMDRAAVVVTHGGAGAIATALRHGKKPIVMTRLQRLGEHVDDHQAQLVGKLGSFGLVAEATDRIGPSIIAELAAPSAVPEKLARLPSVGETLQRLCETRE